MLHHVLYGIRSYNHVIYVARYYEHRHCHFAFTLQHLIHIHICVVKDLERN